MGESAEFGGDEPTPAPVNPTQSPVNPTQPPSSPVAAPNTGPVSSPIESPVEDQFELIFEETFDEGEYEEFVNIGTKVVQSSNANPTFSGDHSLRLRKKQNVRTKFKGISNYSSVKVDFKYYGKSIEPDESFKLMYKFNGSPWTEAARWVRGQDFENNEWNDASVTLETNNKNKVRFRIKGQGDQGNDRIFIDNFVLSGQ